MIDLQGLICAKERIMLYVEFCFHIEESSLCTLSYGNWNSVGEGK